MNEEELKSTIKQIKESQERYNQEITTLIEQLKRANLKGDETPNHTEPRRLSVGDQVSILNPSRFGDKEGKVFKLTKSRVTVKTTKGKVVQAYKNVRLV